MDIIHNLVTHYGYPGLFVVIALGNMGIPTGTEIVIPFAGALAGQGHFATLPDIPAWICVATVSTIAEIAGGSILYAIGYYGGLPFVHRYGKYVMFREHELERVHAFYQRYGNVTVLLSRFIPFLRGVSAFPAGISRMQKRYFITYTALGSMIYCFGLAALGNALGKRTDQLLPVVHKFSVVIAVVVIVAIVGAAIWWFQRRRSHGRGAN